MYIGFEAQQELLEEERQRDESDFINQVDPGRSVIRYLQEVSGASDKEVREAIILFGLEECSGRGLKYLSSGELRKTIIASAFLSRPAALILDDPFESLDIESRKKLYEVFERLHERGIPLVFMLNRVEEVPSFATHAAFLKSGSLLIKGDISIIRSPEFLQLLKIHRDIPDELPGMTDIVRNPIGKKPLVEMKNVRIAYHEEGDRTNEVFHDFDFRVDEGEHWRITGPNGVGKSTLLKLISGDHPQCYSNDIRIFGMKRGSGESIWDVKKDIGIVSSALQFDYRVRTTVLTTIISGFYDSIGMYRAHTPREEELARQWLRLMGMGGEENDSFQELSFGRKRMVLIARAMVKHPRILILDEPCQGIDPVHRELILKLTDIIASRGKTTVLYVTHHPEDSIPSIKKHLRLTRRRCLGNSA